MFGVHKITNNKWNHIFKHKKTDLTRNLAKYDFKLTSSPSFKAKYKYKHYNQLNYLDNK
jgi:hypothetical protein